MMANNEAFPASAVTILIIIILVQLLLTAITSGSETAYFSLTSKDINYLKTKETGAARQTIRLLDQPKMLLATILIGNNFINISIVITMKLLMDKLFPGMSEAMLFIVNAVVVTFLLVLFGEVLPKVYATQNNMRAALFAAPILQTLNRLFRPVSRLLVSSTNYIEKRIGSKTASAISGKDFEHAIELTVGHTATKQEVNIFKGILKFSNISVTQIMRTRMDVGCIPYDISFAEVQKIAIELGYSRMPVYKESLDKIVGIIHTKDFLPHMDETTFDWHTLIRQAYFVHEGKMIEDLLKEFQTKRIHFAIVVDEFGGTSGIVTLEDIMEEIIGEIKDEFDDDEHQYKKIDDNNFIFEGKTLINDACRIMGLSSDTFDEVRDESESIAGLVLELAGKFPAVNEMVSYQNYDLTVLNLDKMRIQRVKITINRPQEETEAEE
ncbi:MAG: gliding motility-associated protein GldE [Chitinophagaceae bacterium]|nr:gliding motility-associated protein GldE [Chitinophagaceae bacterium]